MTKVYIYENGSCRGDQFTNRSSVNVDVLISFLEATTNMDDDAVSDMLGEQERNGLDSDVVTIMGVLHCGGITGTERDVYLQNLKAGTSFKVEWDEQDFGVGFSPKQALLAYMEGLEEIEEDWG